MTEWLYPHPTDLRVEWIPFGEDQKGVGVIIVPPQMESSKPFLIRRTVGDRRGAELLLGYAERRLDTTHVKSVVEIHQALRTGFNPNENFLVGSQYRIASRPLLSAESARETAESRELLLKNRIAALVHEAGIVNNKRFLVLAAAPMQPSEPKTIFSDRQGSIRRKLENSSNLRDGAWGLPRMAQIKFVEGELVRLDGLPRLMVDLYRDGTLLILANVYRNFLAWSDQRDSAINPRA